LTCQLPEQIEYQGELLSMHSEPLRQLLPDTSTHGMNFCGDCSGYPFEVSCTALWRGYVGHWKIDGDRLFLLSLHGRLVTGAEATIADVLPSTNAPVFADWFNGELWIEHGPVIGQVDGVYLNVHEESIILNVRAGVIIGKRIVKNEVPVDEVDEESD
jgi:hypothetical protein